MAIQECTTHPAGSSENARTPFQSLQALSKGINDAVMIDDEVSSLIAAAEQHTGRPSDVLNTLKAAKQRHEDLANLLATLDEDACDVEAGIEGALKRGLTPVANLDEADRALVSSELKAVLEAAEEAHGTDAAIPLLNAGTRLSALLRVSYLQNQDFEVHTKALPVRLTTDADPLSYDGVVKELERIGNLAQTAVSASEACLRTDMPGDLYTQLSFIHMALDNICIRVDRCQGYGMYGSAEEWLVLPEVPRG